MEFRRTSRERSGRGFTLLEMMVALAIGCLVLGAGVSVYLFSVRSFASMANYSDLNEKSRNASDMISRDIRCCVSVTSATTNQLVLKEPDGSSTAYVYDKDAGLLVRANNGAAQVLLSGVNSLSFSLYQRPTNSLAGYEEFPMGTPASAKLIAFQWSCSRRLAGSQDNSERLEAAIVEMRNQ
jgi:prepilin-type N-terminal cleavage/methylation domain-containing protein